jgi:hypothetical protein
VYNFPIDRAVSGSLDSSVVLILEKPPWENPFATGCGKSSRMCPGALPVCPLPPPAHNFQRLRRGRRARRRFRTLVYESCETRALLTGDLILSSGTLPTAATCSAAPLAQDWSLLLTELDQLADAAEDQANDRLAGINAWGNFVSVEDAAWETYSTDESTAWDAYVADEQAAWDDYLADEQAAFDVYAAAEEIAFTAYDNAEQVLWGGYESGEAIAWAGFLNDQQTAWSNFALTNTPWSNAVVAQHAAEDAFVNTVESAYATFKTALDSAWSAFSAIEDTAWAAFTGGEQLAWDAAAISADNAWTAYESGEETAWTDYDADEQTARGDWFTAETTARSTYATDLAAAASARVAARATADASHIAQLSQASDATAEATANCQQVVDVGNIISLYLTAADDAWTDYGDAMLDAETDYFNAVKAAFTDYLNDTRSAWDLYDSVVETVVDGYVAAVDLLWTGYTNAIDAAVPVFEAAATAARNDFLAIVEPAQTLYYQTLMYAAMIPVPGPEAGAETAAWDALQLALATAHSSYLANEQAAFDLYSLGEESLWQTYLFNEQTLWDVYQAAETLAWETFMATEELAAETYATAQTTASDTYSGAAQTVFDQYATVVANTGFEPVAKSPRQLAVRAIAESLYDAVPQLQAPWGASFDPTNPIDQQMYMEFMQQQIAQGGGNVLNDAPWLEKVAARLAPDVLAREAAGLLTWGPLLYAFGYDMDDAALMLKNLPSTVAGGATGLGHGAAIVGNHLTLNSTFGWIDALGMPLDAYIDGQIAQNGGLYHVANYSGWIGASALHAAGAVWAWGAAGLPTFGLGVGRGVGLTRLHVFYGATPWGGGAMTWQHALGRGMWVIGADSTTVSSAYFTLTGMPILAPAAALSLHAARNCGTAAFHAFWRGWFLWP